jgi:ribosomal protein S18 acetylase RimI-like enzyme
MNIESIEHTHLLPCAALFAAVFNKAPWNEQWDLGTVRMRLTEIYNTPGAYGVVASDVTGVMGFVLGYVEQWNQQKHFYLKEMCVHAQQQRSGIGTAMMDTLERQLMQRGVSKIYLLTARESGAEAFYRTCGFYVSPKMIMMGKPLE